MSSAKTVQELINQKVKSGRRLINGHLNEEKNCYNRHLNELKIFGYFNNRHSIITNPETTKKLIEKLYLNQRPTSQFELFNLWEKVRIHLGLKQCFSSTRGT